MKDGTGLNSDSDSNLDIECTGWTGGVCYVVSDSEDSDSGYTAGA